MNQGTIDADRIRRLITSQFLALSASVVEAMGEGWDFHAFAVDHQWVFRFPKSTESDGRLRMEVRLLKCAAPQLPVQVPRYEFSGKPDEGFPFYFAGYRKLPGVPAWGAELAPAALTALARQLGELVAQIHSFDPAHAAALGVESCADDSSMAASREGACQDLAQVSELLDPGLREKCRAFLEDKSRLPPEHDGPEHVLHNDLGPEHVLVDPDSGEITGVIDWTDVSTGDPALDFAPCYAWQGEAFLQDMLKMYHLPVDPGFCDRVRYRAVCVAVGNIYFGAQTRQSAYLRSGVEWLGRLV